MMSGLGHVGLVDKVGFPPPKAGRKAPLPLLAHGVVEDHVLHEAQRDAIPLPSIQVGIYVGV